MDFFLPQIFSGLSIPFACILFLILSLNIFGLPANWLILGSIALWQYIWPFAPPLTFFQWIALIFLALSGELAEMAFQFLKARKYGSSSSGTFASLVGALLGAIILSPIFWGLGALPGALLGAWLACYAMERLQGKPAREAIRAAYGAMLGRFLGTITKIGIGVFIIFLALRWFSYSASLPPFDSLPEGETLHVISIPGHYYPDWYPFS